MPHRPGVSGRRLLRGTVLGTAILAVTLAGHAAGGGHLPSLGYYLALLPLAVMLSLAATARRRSLVTLIALTIGLQALLHVLMVVIGAHGTHGVRMLPSALMLAVHLGAAIVVGWSLAHGDTLIDRWLAFWQAFAASFLDLWQPRIAVAAFPAPVPGASITRPALRDAIIRRGPPLHS